MRGPSRKFLGELSVEPTKRGEAEAYGQLLELSSRDLLADPAALSSRNRQLVSLTFPVSKVRCKGSASHIISDICELFKYFLHQRGSRD